MKKIILTSVAALSIALMPMMAKAYDSTGCGLGSMAWRGQSGTVPQILAATTNGLFGSQTFGITSGTSGCDPNGRITGGTGKMIAMFLENNLEQYAFDASRGQGETIRTLAGIANVSEEKVASISKEHFNELFPDENVDSITVAVNLMNMLNIKA